MKNLYLKPFFNHRNFILSELESLDLNCEETMVLLCIDFDNEYQVTFDIETTAKKCKLSPNRVDEIMNALVEKSYLEIVMCNKQVQYRLDGVFKVKENLEVLPSNEFRSLFDMFEEAFGRPLTSNEAERLSEWMGVYELKLIEYALREAIVYEKRSFDYVNAILFNWEDKKIKAADYENGKR